MVTGTLTDKYRIHLDCGGNFRYCEDWYGKPVYECDHCGTLWFKSRFHKGVESMPFPKDVKRPGDIPEVKILHKLEDFNGIDLLLRGSGIKKNEQYGDGIVLECETEDGVGVEILTFSQVIAEQLVALADHLPLIIRPINNGTYYTIY